MKNRWHDEEGVSWKDSWAVWRLYRRQYRLLVMICLMVCVCYALSFPLSYESKALFIDKGYMKGQGLDPRLHLAWLSPIESQAIHTTTFKSSAVLLPTIRSLGLQSWVVPDRNASVWRRMYHNVWAEWAFWSRRQTPLFPLDHAAWTVRDVTYASQEVSTLTLDWITPSVFVCQGRLGSIGRPFTFSQGGFTLWGSSQDLESTHIQCIPESIVLDDLRKRVFVQLDQKDNNLLEIAIRDARRHMAPKILDHIVFSYLDYRHREHARITQAQQEILLSRDQQIQQEYQSQLSLVFSQMAQDVDMVGFPTIQMALDFHTKSLEKIEYRMLVLERNIQKVRGVMEGSMRYDLLPEALVSEAVLDSIEQLHVFLLNHPSPFIPTDVSFLESRSQLEFYQERHRQEAENVRHLMFVLQQHHLRTSSLRALIAPLPSHPLWRQLETIESIEKRLHHSEGFFSQDRVALEKELERFWDLSQQFVVQMLEMARLEVDSMRKALDASMQTAYSAARIQKERLEKQLLEELTRSIEHLEHELSQARFEKRETEQYIAQLSNSLMKEKLLQQAMEFKRIQLLEMGKLVETQKNSASLDLTQSVLLDAASLPMLPLNPHLVLSALLGGFVGMLLVLGHVCVILVRGFRVDEFENTRLKKQL